MENSYAQWQNSTQQDDLNERPKTHMKWFNLSQLLRLVGGFGIVLSAIIFMVQGLNDVSDSIRNWIYPVFICCLCAGGLAVRFGLGDLKSGRLLCIMALLLVPVHISQMAAWIYIWTGDISILGDWVLTPNISLAQAGSIMVGSILLFLPVVYFGFGILVRQHRGVLGLIYVLINLALLLPVRDGFTGFTPLMFQLLLLVSTNILLFSKRSMFTLFDGQVAKAILMFPLCIALGRFSFYVDSLLMFGILGLMLGGLMVYLAQVAAQSNLAVRLLELLGFCLSSMSLLTIVFSIGIESLGAGGLAAAAWLISAGSLWVGHQRGALKKLYFNIAGGLWLIVTALLVTRLPGLGYFAAISSTFVYGFVACRFKNKALLFWSALSSLYCMLVTVQLVFENQFTNHWVWLAMGGFGAIIIASMWDRFGNKALAAIRRGAAEVSAWG